MEKMILPLYFLSLFTYSSAYTNNNNQFLSCISQNNLSNIVYSPSNPSFPHLLTAYIKNNRFNRTTTHKPTLILTPTDEPQVSAVVRCATASDVLLKIRSGGHDYEGISYVSDYDFAILDMFNLNSISVDVNLKTATVGAGALLGELYYAIWNQSKTLAFPAGVCPTVGIGGHISGGGYGNMLRKFGLSVDNMIDAKIVVANGSILNRASMGPDLFWAIRGGGGASFGVILSYTLQLVTINPTVTVFRVVRFPSDDSLRILYDYQNVVPKLDKDLFIRVLMQPTTQNATPTVRATFVGMFLGDSKRLRDEILTPNFPSLGLKETDCKEMSWIESVLFWANFDNKTRPEVLLNRSSDKVGFLKRKSDYVKTPIKIADLEKIFQVISGNKKAGMVWNSYGGRMDEISESSVPFPHRKGNLYKMQYFANWDDPSKEAEDAYLTEIRNLYNNMTSYVSSAPRESYINYRDLDIGTNGGKNSYAVGKVYGESYFKGNYDRLVSVKTAVDPRNFFRNEQSIPTWHE